MTRTGNLQNAKPVHVNEEIRYMSAIASRSIDAKNAPRSGRLFFLDLGASRILSANADGSDLKTIISEGRRLPDGLVLDVAAGIGSEEMVCRHCGGH
jgi:hypothetical protein